MIAGLWLGIGLVGQAMFSARFLVQWWASEREGRSVIPHSFWYLSIAGSLSLVAYAIYQRDPVFIIGQGAGLAIYMRNIRLIRRQSRAPEALVENAA
ncbi:lipid-A-disaccharide synthase N-terminal domain-containing protein [Ancylobacter sp. WKF20]|uniref:lipid-A-disaccharide synthase N-terminal domain-containing protein n=1 Tax=Ancylobacter sp. WKF20 TaxID=3039801 RepID=UPI00243438ED|nr:lipid-A-disaccharide synthase N-terminal domain-containing protein [Ancylobacter sp. WKF20]WGD29091.1 lipid-A-disaccharide synthase N-terminal domain-containing protein [Ancylobacter sp. WKF20]